VLAQEDARFLNHDYIGTEHLLLGLIHAGEGVAAKTLEALDITLEAVRGEVEKVVGQGPVQALTNSPPFTPRAKRVLELSLREALQLGHNYIGTEHILLGILREGEGVAARVLVSLGAELAAVREEVIKQLSGFEGSEAAGPTRTAGVLGFQADSPQSHPRGKVGDAWSVEVVRAGRTPEVFAEAYRRVEELVAGIGVELSDSRIGVTSVETDEGPGLRLVVRQELEDNSVVSDDGDADAAGSEAPT
jgi:ATP-dependent Clp protease ATP-binding subunit ClpA